VTTYKATRALDFGSGEEETRHFVDRPADPATGEPEVGHDEVHGTVLHYEEGDVVPGADKFENLGDLLALGFLVEAGTATKKRTSAAEEPAKAAPRKRATAKRSGSRSR